MENKSKLNKYKIAMIIIVTMFVTILATTFAIFVIFLNGKQIGKYILVTNYEENEDISNELNKFRTLIDKYYLGDVNDEKLKEGAIMGYIAGLNDPYTVYITKDEMKEYMENIDGSFVGIGIYMTIDNKKDLIKVSSTIKDSPAEKAGIKEGDLILTVDGKEYTADDFNIISKKIKGEPGTIVTLEILRDEETIKFEIQRQEIITHKVEGKIIENNIGYIKVSSFDNGTDNEFEEMYKQLKEEGAESLIIDLRNNGGGMVDKALKIADLIVEKDKVLLYEVDKEGNEKEEKSKETPIINMPIIVLVNGETASASEILAGALKDLEKAKIVGTETYGKGIIQTILDLPDGSGLKITTEEYMTPNRVKIHKKGIQPDEEVLDKSDKEDTQLQKAVELLK